MTRTMQSAAGELNACFGRRTPPLAAVGRALCALALLAATGCSGGGGSTPSASAPPPAPAAPAEARLDPAQAMRVAMLAPVGAVDASLAAAARSLVDGARLAAEEAGPGLLSLDIVDTRGDAGGTAAAAREGLSGGAGLIVGPLLGANAAAAAAPAAAAGVNVISFSNTPAVAGGADGNVWIAGLRVGDAVERALRHAATLGVGTVGIYHPRDGSGEAALAAAASAAQRFGLRLAPRIGYPRSFDGIQESAGGYAAAHAAEGAGAVLLPDGGQGLQAAAAFINFNGVDTRRTQYLGAADWDDPATLLENALRGGRFAALDPVLKDAFTARFQARYGRSPGPLSWLGHETVAAVAAMARRGRASGDATPFDAAAITDPAGFATAMGRLRFTPDGMNTRELAILQVVDGGFARVEAAPSAPADAPPAELPPLAGTPARVDARTAAASAAIPAGPAGPGA